MDKLTMDYMFGCLLAHEIKNWDNPEYKRVATWLSIGYVTAQSGVKYRGLNGRIEALKYLNENLGK